MLHYLRGEEMTLIEAIETHQKRSTDTKEKILSQCKEANCDIYNRYTEIGHCPVIFCSMYHSDKFKKCMEGLNDK